MKSNGLKLLPVFLAGTLAGALSYGFVLGSIVNIQSQKTDFQPHKLTGQNWTCTELLSSSLDEIDIRSDDNQPIVLAIKPLSQRAQEIIIQQGEVFSISYLGNSFESQDVSETDNTISFVFFREYPWDQTEFTALLNKQTGFMVLSATSKIDDRDVSRVSGFQKSFSCK